MHYLADTPDGAWAEFLRHEEIREPEDIPAIRRSLWAVRVPDERYPEPELPFDTLSGDPDTYPACQAEARRLRAERGPGLRAPSAALLPGSAGGWRVAGGLQPGIRQEGSVIALFGPRPDVVGWAAAAEGRPREDLLPLVRHFAGGGA